MSTQACHLPLVALAASDRCPRCGYTAAEHWHRTPWQPERYEAPTRASEVPLATVTTEALNVAFAALARMEIAEARVAELEARIARIKEIV